MNEALYEKVDILTKNKVEQRISKFLDFVGNKKIIFWGANSHGRTMLRLFYDMGLKVDRFIDRHYESLKKVSDVEVFSPEFVKRMDLDDTVLIATVNQLNYASIKKDLLMMGRKDVAEQLIDGYRLHLPLQKCICYRKMNLDRGGGDGFRITDCQSCTQLNHTCEILAEYIQRNKPNSSIRFDGADMTLIGSILGTVCTLKCKHCVEHVPYISKENKKFYDKEKILSDIRKIAASCRYITVIDFIGGEPFLHPDLAYIVSQVINIPNVGIVNIFTNGTVMPGSELVKALKKDFVTVSLSNYSQNLNEEQKERIHRFKKYLEETEGIDFFETKDFTWFDTLSFQERRDSEEKLKERFSNCRLKDCYRLSEGKLFRCVHHYAGYVTNKLPLDSSAIDLSQYESSQKLTQEINDFMALPYIDSCRFCELPFEADAVASGEQVE